MTRRTIAGSLGVLLLLGAGGCHHGCPGSGGGAPPCRRSKSTRRGPGFPTTGSWATPRRSPSTGTTTSGSFTGRARCRQKRRTTPRRRFWSSTRTASSCRRGAVRPSACEWPDTEHGIYVDYKDNVWIGGNNPNVQIRVSPRSDDMLLKFTSKGKLMKQIGKRDQSKGNKDTRTCTSRRTFKSSRRRTRPWSPTATATAASSCSTPIPARSSACGARSATSRWRRRRRHGDGRRPRRRRAISKARGRSSGASSTPSGFRTTDSSTWPIAATAASRSSRSTASIRRRCSSTGRTRAPRPPAASRFRRIRSRNILYVSDFGNGHVWILDRKSLSVLGHFGEQGPEPGNFRNAHHMATDSKGNLYTAEVNPGSRVQRFIFKGVKPPAATASR